MRANLQANNRGYNQELLLDDGLVAEFEKVRPPMLVRDPFALSDPSLDQSQNQILTMMPL